MSTVISVSSQIPIGMGKVPDLFKRPSNLASLRPAAIQQHVQLHQHQISAASAKVEEPQLLQRLHACLDAAAIQEALSNHTQQQSITKQQTRRQLNAYHEVFQLLLASLTTYRCAESCVPNVHTNYCHAHARSGQSHSPTPTMPDPSSFLLLSIAMHLSSHWVRSRAQLAVLSNACCVASQTLHCPLQQPTVHCTWHVCLYRPLLLRIKHVYDEALKDAAAVACDNVYLLSKLSMVPHRHVSAAAGRGCCCNATPPQYTPKCMAHKQGASPCTLISSHTLQVLWVLHAVRF